jgi:hypothetical protein
VFGHELDGFADLLGDRVADAVLQFAATNCALGDEPVQELVGGAGAVATDQQVLAPGCGDLGDRLGQDSDVIGRGVRSGLPGSSL